MMNMYAKLSIHVHKYNNKKCSSNGNDCVQNRNRIGTEQRRRKKKKERNDTIDIEENGENDKGLRNRCWIVFLFDYTRSLPN